MEEDKEMKDTQGEGEAIDKKKGILVELTLRLDLKLEFLRAAFKGISYADPTPKLRVPEVAEGIEYILQDLQRDVRELYAFHQFEWVSQG